jgi:hypothetical protein
VENIHRLGNWSRLTSIRLGVRFCGAMGITIQVDTTNNRGVGWPPMCACCGDKPDSGSEIEFIKYRAPHSQERSIYRVPACRICHEHRKKVQVNVPLFVFLFLLGAMVSLGVGSETETGWGFLCFLTWIIVQIAVHVLVQRSAESSAAKIMKPNCTARDFISFRRVLQRPTFFSVRTFDIFTFANDSYARTFSTLNRGREVRSEDT